MNATTTVAPLPATKRDIGSFFDEPPDQLPAWRGCDAEYLLVWRGLNKTDKIMGFRRVAIALSLDRAQGQRTDRGRGPTAIHEFCTAANIKANYFSRLVKLGRVFTALLLTGESKKSATALLRDERLTFTHYLLAAYAADPITQLQGASRLRLSTRAMQRRIACEAFDDDVADLPDDDAEPLLRLPTRPLFHGRPHQHRLALQYLQTLKRASGTATDIEIVLDVLRRAAQAVEHQRATELRAKMAATA